MSQTPAVLLLPVNCLSPVTCHLSPACHLSPVTCLSPSLAVLRLQDSQGIHDLGYPQWQLVLCIGAVYCLLYISLFKVPLSPS